MNCKWLRQLSCMLALLLAAMAAQSEDLHLKKNISVGGNVVSSSETSIKGQRTRDVTQTPAGATVVSLRQCDLKRTVTSTTRPKATWSSTIRRMLRRHARPRW